MPKETVLTLYYDLKITCLKHPSDCYQLYLELFESTSTNKNENTFKK